MDRKSEIAGGVLLVAMTALWFAGRAPTKPPVHSLSSRPLAEPAQLDLSGVTIQQLVLAEERVRPTASFFSDNDRQALDGGLEWITPAEATPKLAAPQDAVIDLPSKNSIPAPLERVPATGVVSQPVNGLPPASHMTQQQSAVSLRPAPLVAAVARAEQMTADGLRLAQRGAIFSARARFLQALRQITSAQDQVQETTRCTVALNAALMAMQESRDFEVRHATSSDPVDVARVAAGHRSKILRVEELSSIAPPTAFDRYQRFAVEQLTLALGAERDGSMPLYGLGRIATASGKANPNGDVGCDDALVWYHAALMVDARNFRAAHELGSLYAKRSEWERARTVLQRAIAIQSHPTTWSNLAIVHGKLGESDWAAAARSRAQVAAAPGCATGNLPPIRWVDADSFAKTTGPNEVYFPQQTNPPVVAQPPVYPAPRSAARPRLSTSWLPWKSSPPK